MPEDNVRKWFVFIDGNENSLFDKIWMQKIIISVLFGPN